MSYFVENNDLKLRNICFSYSFQSIFLEPNLKNRLPANFISDCSENATMEFVLFCQKIINIVSAKFSPILLLRIGYSVTPNPIVYMTNDISYYEA